MINYIELLDSTIYKIYKMNKIVSLIVIMLLSMGAQSEKVIGMETPACWGKPIKNEKQVKCIVFFLAEFESTLYPLGENWDVLLKKSGNIWLVYPKIPTKEIPKNVILYKINSITGKPVGWESKSNK